MTRKTSPLLLAACLLYASAAFAAEELAPALLELQQAWARATYRTSEDQLDEAFARLTAQADALVRDHPGRAEPLAWKAIVLSTRAGKVGGLHALGWAKEARDLLLQAEQIDPRALNGSIHTSLGSLYYKVPGWPIGFGDKKKAEQHLKKALAINPDGIDPNYFYADFLASQGRYPEALRYARHALEAPPRPGRELADSGRRAEAKALLERVQRQIAHNDQRQRKGLWN